MPSTYQRHLAAIQSGTVTKTNVIGVRKALNHAARLSRGWSGNRSSFTVEQADDLLEAIHKHRPRVTGGLHDSGLALLQGKRYAKRLSGVASITAAIDHFELRDFQEDGHGHFTPIYRAATADGIGFDFCNVPWQSGGNGPELI